MTDDNEIATPSYYGQVHDLIERSSQMVRYAASQLRQGGIRDLAYMDVLAALIDLNSLLPAIAQRGFRLPVLRLYTADPVGHIYDWADFLEKIESHVVSDDQLNVEAHLAQIN